MLDKLSVADLDLKSQLLFIRVDFNVPLDKDANITDDTRIRAALPTIKYALEHKGRVVLASHLGRPKGKVVKEMSLLPVARRLESLLDVKVLFAKDCIGPEVNTIKSRLEDGEIVLLENLRFHQEETGNDPGFCEALATGMERYVNDAFGTAHRAHASTVGITSFFDVSAAGFLIEKEIRYLGNAVSDPERPLTAILGGAKISGKIDVIQNFLPRVDNLLIGGGMTYTFFRAQGFKIGDSLLEEEKISLAADILKEAEAQKVNLVLPFDTVIADKIDPGAQTRVITGKEIPPGWAGVDIGPETIKKYAGYVKNSGTIVCNGPMGIFEMTPFARGTLEITQALAESSGTTIVGGGDSVAAVRQAGLVDRITHVSTGGGASLDFLAGKVLPAIEVLTDKK